VDCLICTQNAAAGGIASAFSSIATTPADVVKTRLATGLLPPGTNAFHAMRNIVAADGVSGLFVGVKARLLLSALFGGVGFASFEWFKRRLGVEQQHHQQRPSPVVAASSRVKIHVQGGRSSL
jgi:Mitochondrial carrier protein